MLERFIESKPIETKETAVKRLAREMLERFRARFKRGEKVEHIEKPIPSPGPVAAEEVKIIAKEQEVGVEPQQPEEPEIKIEREKKTDKGTFESIATNNYFEGWDEDVELEGNLGIKEQIRQNIIEAEKTNQEKYEHAAADLSISVEKLKARLQAKVEDMVKGANFFRATQVDVLEKIMNVDGRWKSQFETGTSGGCLDPRYRAEEEMRMFGFNRTNSSEISTATHPNAAVSEKALKTDKEKRPIYGYFSDEEHGAINDQGKIPPPTNVRMYGTINFKIKKERALRKSTITFHDSLGVYDWPPTPATKPHFVSFPLSYSGGRILNELKGPSVANWNHSYTEVQYHDGLTMDDVESIHVSTHNGVHPEDVEKIRGIFKKYKKQHTESTIQLIEF